MNVLSVARIRREEIASETNANGTPEKGNISAAGVALLDQRPDLSDDFFETYGAQLTPQDIEDMWLARNKNHPTGVVLALLRECNKRPFIRESLTYELTGALLLEAGRTQDDDLLDTLLTEMGLGQRHFKNGRGEGNVVYLAACVLMRHECDQSTIDFLLKRLADAGCDINTNCRHEIKKLQSYDFETPLAMACALLDVKREYARGVIDGLVRVGADTKALSRGAGEAAKHLRKVRLRKTVAFIMGRNLP